MIDKSTPDQVRDIVASTYGQRIAESSSCCSTSCCAPPEGYENEKMKASEAPTSFGCCNPLAFSEVKEGETVVDLGSGAGLDLLLAAQRVGPRGRVIGIDMTDEMIAEAERNIAKSGHRHVEVRKGIIEDLPVEDAATDWVISNCVINLSPEKSRVFAEIARVLRPGGKLSVTDIVAEDLPDEIRASSHLYSSCVSGAISEADYISGLEAAGLEGVETEELLVYEGASLRAIADDLEIPKALSEAYLPRLNGKVRSLRFTARKSG